MKAPMTDKALKALLAEPLVAKLATHARDGGIRMTPLWFRRDADGAVVFATWAKTAAVQNIRREPRCSVLIDFEGGEPYYGAHLEGTAAVNGPENDLEGIAALYAPYKGSLERAREDVRGLIAEGTMVFVRFMPERVVSWDFRE